MVLRSKLLMQQTTLPSFTRRHLLCVAAALSAGLLAPNAIGFDSKKLAQQMLVRYGERGVRALEQWFKMLEAQDGKPLNQQLSAVNDFWNEHLLAGLDPQIWLQADYWATPLESLGRGAGDCEDFVIGKYFSLRRLGVPSRQMRFIYVRARAGGVGSTQSVAHMVLGFYETPQSDPIVLDNLVGSLQKASQRSDLTPVFSFDTEGVYVGGTRSASSDRINRWQGLLVRMRQEGFDV